MISTRSMMLVGRPFQNIPARHIRSLTGAPSTMISVCLSLVPRKLIRGLKPNCEYLTWIPGTDCSTSTRLVAPVALISSAVITETTDGALLKGCSLLVEMETFCSINSSRGSDR